MKRLFRKQFRKGAASFYIVAFATLILVIIAMSFAVIIISEMARTSNDDLSQSAYDSALAGVEDAKLAFSNYRNCLGKSATAPNGDGKVTCGEIVYWMEHPDCDMVGHITGRIKDSETGPVVIKESNTVNNNMSQQYTCVMIETSLSDYRSTLTKGQSSKVVRVNFENPDIAKDVQYVRLSWYADSKTSSHHFSNFNSTQNKVEFKSLTTDAKSSIPPTVSLTLIQTAKTFSFSDFDMTVGDRTDRGTVFLVPTDDAEAAAGSLDYNYIGAYDSSRTTDFNYVSAANGFLKSNNKEKNNRPFAVYCPGDTGTEYACSVLLEIPKPVNGDRNTDTFAFVVSVPYGKPTTDFALEFLCANGKQCAPESVINGEGGSEIASQAFLKGSQIKIDSTGQANDLFRRVESRLESETSGLESSFMQYAITLTETENQALMKDLKVTKEWGL